MAFIQALKAERLKMKRTLALWLAPIAPLVIIGLQLAVVLERQAYFRTQDASDAWVQYGGQTVFLWTMLMLPLFITLETALLGNLEHSNQQWKHLFALPIPRAAVYAAKQVSGMAIIGLSMVAMYVYIVLSGLGLRLIAPDLGFEAPVPWGEFFEYIALGYLASWLIISIHTWVSLRWHSFVVASAVGIVAMVIAVVLFQSDWNQWYPWAIPGMVAYGLEEGTDTLPQLLIGILGGVAVALVGGWDVVRRDVL
ncbi:MAG TPA: ABC transporter permease [Anaerolineae bacterium]|nr:ABC transporter permease [Anaerolineae bacterium]